MEPLWRRAEDAVRYQLFLLPPGAEQGEDALPRCAERVLARLAPLLVSYVWQREPFSLRARPARGTAPRRSPGAAAACPHVGGGSAYPDPSAPPPGHGARLLQLQLGRAVAVGVPLLLLLRGAGATTAVCCPRLQWGRSPAGGGAAWRVGAEAVRSKQKLSR